MAYPDNSRNRFNQPRQTQFKPQLPEKIEAEPLPKDYVEKAEDVMRELIENGVRITTSKIRNLLSMISDIYNVENMRDDPDLKPESKAAVTMLRIRVAYEAGRDQQVVGTFVKKAKLLQYIKDIGSDREKLINFAHYMEALVAYHRFYGGREG